jgi:alditol oxidase
MLPRNVQIRSMTEERNWAGNLVYSAARIHRPESLAQVQKIVRNSTKLRALGTRHSFNPIADCLESMISLERLDRIVVIDKDHRTVTLESGVTYGKLSRHLHEAGFALPNLASLPHISVAGACATATHGSGDRNGNLATTIAAMELITADGNVITVSRKDDAFDAMVVGLGAFGIITKLTLDVVPQFQMRQDVYENLPLRLLENYFDDMMSAAYSVSLFTDWQSDCINQAWLKSPAEAAVIPGFFGATPAPADRHPIVTISAENCTPQMGLPGASHERLPHFRLDYTPSSGDELQSEYFIPRPHAAAAIRAVADLRQKIAPLLLISEIRTVAADRLWLSPCFNQACATIHFTWKPDWPAVQKLLAIIEEHLAPFDARPHWGKLFTTPPARLRSLYKKMPDVQQLLKSHDPSGKFRNAFLDRNIFE